MIDTAIKTAISPCSILFSEVDYLTFLVRAFFSDKTLMSKTMDITPTVPNKAYTCIIGSIIKSPHFTNIILIPNNIIYKIINIKIDIILADLLTTGVNIPIPKISAETVNKDLPVSYFYLLFNLNIIYIINIFRIMSRNSLK